MSDLVSSKSYTICAVLCSILFRWITSLYGHSGQSKPPMFGDYEAQRHWMEVTLNLDVADWYQNTTNNDLSYWGLDYPPLTAYHSYLMGVIADKIDPSFVTLFESRGIETVNHKLFMRSTVFISDLTIFYTSTFLVVNQLFNGLKRTHNHILTIFLVLLNPSLVLIDHGHFQYNCISLGLAQLAIYWLLSKRSNELPLFSLISASVFFSLALNYKQMELYHALPFFFYLLAICINDRTETKQKRFFKLCCVGLTVIVTFVLLWLPFILNGLDLTIQVLTRLFPFQRGLFEDKVANFWCSISVLLKLREKISIDALSKLSLIVTGLFNLPSGIDLFLRPTRPRFLLSLVNSALIFFLFSFQVHEKSILLVTIPACLLVNSYPLLVTWFMLVSNLSMLPLLFKDGLTTACISQTLFFCLITTAYSKNFWTSVDLKQFALLSKQSNKSIENLIKFTFFLSIVCSMTLTACFLFVLPPKHLPDLWTVLISIFACIHFLGFSLLFHLIQFSLPSAELGNSMDFSSCLLPQEARVDRKKKE